MTETPTRVDQLQILIAADWPLIQQDRDALCEILKEYKAMRDELDYFHERDDATTQFVRAFNRLMQVANK